MAVLYEPLNVSIYSIQDGKKTLSLPIGARYLLHTSRKQAVATGIWWFRNEQPISRMSIPDIFKRNGLIVRLLHTFSVFSKMDPDRVLSLDSQSTSTA